MVSFDTGCTNSTLCERREILPSALLRGEPYFRSPLIGHPILANWHLISDSITLAYDEIHHVLGRSTRKSICLILTQNLSSERNITKLLYCCEVEVSTEITSLILQALETSHLGSIVLIELVVREITLILVSQIIVGCTDGRIVVAPAVLGIQCTPGTVGKILYATVLPGIFSLITGRCRR